jgi:hypothetical protein
MLESIHSANKFFNGSMVQAKHNCYSNKQKSKKYLHYSPRPEARFNEAARPALLATGCTAVALAKRALTLML